MASRFRIAARSLALSTLAGICPVFADSPAHAQAAGLQGWWPRFSAGELGLGIVGVLLAAGVGLLLLQRLRRRHADAAPAEWPQKVAQPHLKAPAQPVAPASSAWISLDETTTVVEGLASPEEEVEVFMVLGRMDMAVGVLRQDIQAHGDAQPQTWMSLLDILYREGQRDEFEKLAGEIKAHFNIALPTWEDSNRRSSGLIALEHFPRLLEKIVRLWESPDCRNYLNGLIHDNRDATRSGFQWEVFRELVFLIGIREHRDQP